MEARVLVVEDEPLVAEAIADALAKAGYTVCACVEVGERAACVASQERPSIVLMDICLAGSLDGVATAQSLREAGYEGALVYLTAHASNEVVARAQQTRPHAFLVKPFTPRQLLTTLQIVVARSDEEASLREELSRARGALHQVNTLVADALGVHTPAARAGESVTPSLKRRIDELSSREREVFLRAVRGEPLEAISRALFISPYTTRNHLASIYRKLGVSSRLELSTTYMPVIREGEQSPNA